MEVRVSARNERGAHPLVQKQFTKPSASPIPARKIPFCTWHGLRQLCPRHGRVTACFRLQGLQGADRDNVALSSTLDRVRKEQRHC
jgi:hypothetical protein